MSATQGCSRATHTVLLHLPEMFENILKFLPTKTIFIIQRTCRQWQAVIIALPPPFTRPVPAAAAPLVPVQVNPTMLSEQTTGRNNELHHFNIGILDIKNDFQLSMLATQPPSTVIVLAFCWVENSRWYFHDSNGEGFRVRDVCEAIHESSRKMYRSAESICCAALKVVEVMGQNGTAFRENLEVRTVETWTV